MSHFSRRQWIQKSLLASSAVLIGSRAPSLANNLSIREWNEILRLNWNENPYGPSNKALKAVTAALKFSNHYPDDIISELKEKLGTKYSVKSNQILLTAGSTEVLSLLGQHVGLVKGEILTPWPSFPTMINFGQATGASIKKVDLNDRYELDLDSILENITNETSLVFICNPNNPTSTEVDHEDLKSLCSRVPKNVLICVDEAYIEYSKLGIAGSMVSLVNELPNLIICRTFSKAYGLAGLRIGYAISAKANIDALRRRHTGWELSTGIAPVIGASTTLDDADFLKMCVQKNEEGRTIVYRAFKEWGVSHSQSSTNFIYTRSEHFSSDILAKLKSNNILITKWPDMKDHIRISIGRPDEMHKFVEVVEDFLV